MTRFPRLRFSLRTLVIFVLLVGSAAGLWWRWEPWIIEYQLVSSDWGQEFPSSLLAARECSPDGSRTFFSWREGYCGQTRILDAQSRAREPLWQIDRYGPLGFLDDDTFVFNSGQLAKDRIISRDCELSVYHRRRPEWWWGVAWLPEFWLTLLLASALVWSVWRERRQLRAAGQ